MTAARVGREARAEARRAENARRTAAITNNVDSLLDRHGLGSPANLSVATYNHKLRNILDQLMDTHPVARDYRHARIVLNRRLRSILGAHQRDLKPPPPLYPIIRSHNYRTAEWMRKVREIWTWEDAFKKRLREEPGRDAYSHDTLFGLFLFSAATRSGICDHDILQNVAEHLQTAAHPLSKDMDGYGIRLRLPVSSGTCNEFDNAQGVMSVRYRLDAVSLGLLLRFLKKRPTEQSPIKSVELIPMLKTSLGLAFATPSMIATPEDLCHAALWKVENSIEGSLSAAMSEALLGRTRMLCPDVTAESILQTKNFRPHQLSSLGLFSAYGTDQASPEDASKPIRSVTELERLFRDILSVDGASRKDTTQNLLNRLEPYRHADWPPAAEILFEWLWSLLKEHGLKPSTINRYFTAVGRLWLTVFEELNPALLEADDLASAYDDLIDLIRSNKERNYTRTRLRQLHRFARSRYGLTDIADEIFGGDGDCTLVSARIVPYTASSAILQTIRSMFVSEEEGDQYALMFIIAYRSGLRVGEIKKLRPMDIESSPKGWAFIRANQYANNKTSAALRKIPLSVLLKSDERKLFDNHLVKRRLLDKSGRLPLFTPPGLDTPYDSEEISRSVGDAMNAVLRSKGWKFHHLRHTAFSLLQCVIEGETSLARDMGGWTLNEMQQIREALIGNKDDRRTGHWALALLAGHANPKTTMETYMHLMRSILARKIERTPLGLDADEIAAAAAISLRAARKIETPAALIKALSKPAKKYVAPAPSLLEPVEENVAAPAGPETSAIDDMVTCERVIQTYQETLSLRTAAIRWRIDEPTADRWLQNAIVITNMKTREGKPRHVSRDRIERGENAGRRAVLLPAKPRRQADLKEANEFVSKLYETYARRPDDLKWWATHALSNANLSHPGVSFAAPDDLNRFLQTADEAIPRKRWMLDLVVSDDRAATVWMEVFGSSLSISTREQPQKIRSRRPGGYARLCLLDASFVPGPKGKSEIQWKKYTAKSFRYSFHMLGILIGLNQ
ncbi:MAG: site-specific integrase [Pseudomonadota bacterium]